jgi:hypothetical protein
MSRWHTYLVLTAQGTIDFTTIGRVRREAGWPDVDQRTTRGGRRTSTDLTLMAHCGGYVDAAIWRRRGNAHLPTADPRLYAARFRIAQLTRYSYV